MKDLNEKCNNCKCLSFQFPAEFWDDKGTPIVTINEWYKNHKQPSSIKKVTI